MAPTYVPLGDGELIGVISIICIGIWLMKGTIDFIAERNEQYRKDKK